MFIGNEPGDCFSCPAVGEANAILLEVSLIAAKLFLQRSFPEFPWRLFGWREFGGVLLAELRGEGGVAGGGQLGEERFDAGDGGGGWHLVGVEQRGDEVGRDGFHWLALLESFSR
jgi:hypothetical protein